MDDILHTVKPNLVTRQAPAVSPEDIAIKARADTAVKRGDLPPGGHPVVRSLRRSQLWQVCDAHEIEYDNSADDWYTLVQRIERHAAQGHQIFPLPQKPEPVTTEEKIGEDGLARVDTAKAPRFLALKKQANDALKAKGLPPLPKTAGKAEVEQVLAS